MPDTDAHDVNILARRVARLNQEQGPRVGDYLRRSNGDMHRIAYLFGDRVQPTLWSGSGSFYFGEYGPNYSGGLDESIPVAQLELVAGLCDGVFWIFHHDDAMAHNDVKVSVPCRVYSERTIRSASELGAKP